MTRSIHHDRRGFIPKDLLACFSCLMNDSISTVKLLCRQPDQGPTPLSAFPKRERSEIDNPLFFFRAPYKTQRPQDCSPAAPVFFPAGGCYILPLLKTRAAGP